MEIEIISKETIKPSSPTPQNRRIYHLSIIDQMMGKYHVKSILFYPIYSDSFDQPAIVAKSQCLKRSLSETLTHFYPLAGRVKDNAVIECNDAGVDFVEAHVNVFQSSLFEKPDLDSLHQFFPKETTGSLLQVQANFFKCGSLALAICFSHKFGDASTMATFFKCWSAIASGCVDESVLPKFVVDGISLHPSVDSSIDLPLLDFKLLPKCVARRYVFEESKIAMLKTKVASTTVPEPTRVEAVTALICKYACTAKRRNLGLSNRQSKIYHSINIRKRVSPPLHENSMGNFAIPIMVSQEDEDEMDLRQFVIQMRNVLDVILDQLRDQNASTKVVDALKEHMNDASTDGTRPYNFTSWCRMSFYDTDFGWGKPIWFAPSAISVKNMMVLLDTSDGKGIEAFITASAEDMAMFERNQEFLEFASLNPSIK